MTDEKIDGTNSSDPETQTPTPPTTKKNGSKKTDAPSTDEVSESSVATTGDETQQASAPETPATNTNPETEPEPEDEVEDEKPEDKPADTTDTPDAEPAKMEASSEEEEPEPEDEEPTDFKDKYAWPIRKLIEVARSIGAQFTRPHDRKAIVEAIHTAGETEETLTKDLSVEDYWNILPRESGSGGPVVAVDPLGRFTVIVYPQGNMSLRRHVRPLHTRIPGQPCDPDVIVDFPSTEDIATGLWLLLDECDTTFEADAETLLQKEEDAKNAVPEEPVDPRRPGLDPRVLRMEVFAPEFGLVGGNVVSTQLLPYKLAEGLGVPTKSVEVDVENGGMETVTPLDWSEMTDAVLEVLENRTAEPAAQE